MKKIFFIIALFSLIQACTTQPVLERTVSNAPKEKDEKDDKDDVDKLWVQVNSRKDSLIRSNPTHYWAWMKLNSGDELKPLTNFTGQVTADPHYFNFADIHSESKSGLALVDVDDSGVASYYLDFVRYALFTKAYLEKDVTDELLQAYLAGLKREKRKAPDVIKAALDETRKKREKENAEWVEKYLDKDFNLKNRDLGITGFKDLQKENLELAELGHRLEESLLRSRKANKIYDMGYVVNNSGSSRGLSRYWFSLQDIKDNKKKIIECKELAKPATDYYMNQKNHAQRVQDVLKYYSDFMTQDSYVHSVDKTSFWCRPKHFQFLQREDIEVKLKDKQLLEFSEYLAYWLGAKQSLQSNARGYFQAIQKHPSKYLKLTSDLIKKYEQHIKTLK